MATNKGKNQIRKVWVNFNISKSGRLGLVFRVKEGGAPIFVNAQDEIVQEVAKLMGGTKTGKITVKGKAIDVVRTPKAATFEVPSKWVTTNAKGLEVIELNTEAKVMAFAKGIEIVTAAPKVDPKVVKAAFKK